VRISGYRSLLSAHDNNSVCVCVLVDIGLFCAEYWFLRVFNMNIGLFCVECWSLFC